QQAKRLVAREDFKALPSEKQRIRFLYEQAFQREPSRDEFRLAHEFRQSQQSFRPPPALGAWQYGYGEFDEAAKRVKTFELMPHFTGSAAQGGPALPDPKLGWVTLNENGGHPGND